MQEEKKTSGPNGQLLKSTEIPKTQGLSEKRWPGFLPSGVARNVFIPDSHL